ncbi:MAG TPA: Ku protein [Thermoanaerobaculia bacterium]|nr:Ku protein [Thermoanaerobaculia bacterium]
MARSIWKGSITFGLVNIPVGLHTAEKSRELHFNLLDRRDLTPIHYQRLNAKTGKEVRWEDTVRGFEFEPHRYVVLSDDDLRSANPASTQTIEIIDFVDLAEISPVYFDRPYFLAPERQAARSYALLRETLRRSGKAGIAKVVIRTRQHLAALVPAGDAIVLELMRFHDELGDPAELELPAGRQGLTAKELRLAERLVAAMVDRWDPERYRDDYRIDLKALIDARVAAGQLEEGAARPVPRRPARGKVVDLMSLLRRSLEDGKASPAPDAGRRRGGSRPAAAKPASAPAGRARARKPPPARRPATRSASPAASHRRAARRSG